MSNTFIIEGPVRHFYYNINNKVQILLFGDVQSKYKVNSDRSVELGSRETTAKVLISLANQAFNPPETIVAEPEVIKEEISDEELESLCQELTDAEKQNVLDVQNKVSSLQEQLAEKEAELARIKRSAQKNEKSRKAAQQKWKKMEEKSKELFIGYLYRMQ